MIKRNSKRILLTGGHAATAAYAVIEALKKRDYFKEIFWIGVKGAIEGKNVETLESQILPPLGVTTHWIPGGRVQRKFTVWTIPSLLKIPMSFIASFFLIYKIKPKVILSFGGGVSFPVVFAGWMLGVPIVIHDQTATAGRANEVSSFFAKKVVLSRPSSLKYFPENKSVVLGNPVRSEIVQIKPKAPASYKTILITGGSRGSTTLNELVKPILSKLLTKYKIVHQTGALEYEDFAKFKSELKENKNYQVFPSLELSSMAKFYEESDLIVSRAGANTVSEILAIKRPAVLIPIPWSYKDEQNENAKYIEQYGFAKIVSQDEKPEVLLSAIEDQISSINEIRSKFNNFTSPDLEASSKIATFLESIN